MENLLILRKQKGLLQKEVAQSIGVSRAVYSSYETGIAEPSIETLCKLSDFYNVTIDELVGHSELNSLFSESRVPRAKIQLLLEHLTPIEQAKVLGYIDALINERIK